jgi:hypothetical protein
VQSQLVVIVESRQRTADGNDLQGAADISAERGTGTFSSAVDSRPVAGPERPGIRSSTRCSSDPVTAQALSRSKPPGSPPTVNGTTPCYPAELQRDDVPILEVLSAD